MVKIPALELDRQNWKIYRAKYLDFAATENLLSVIAGWESDNAPMVPTVQVVLEWWLTGVNRSKMTYLSGIPPIRIILNSVYDL